MFPAPFVVVVDANALFPFTLRDTLLRAAEVGFYQLRWSDEILHEVEKNLVEARKMSASNAARLRRTMEAAFPEALITGYEAMVPAMRNHPGDRHVAAAAVKCGAQVIVTSNLKHFTTLPDGLGALSPDEFLCNLFDLDPVEMIDLLHRQAVDLREPAVRFEELLERLRRITPELVALVMEHLEGH
jgi:hypothetical protein